MRLLNLRQLSDELRANTLSETAKYRLIFLMLVLQILRHIFDMLTQRPSMNHLILLIVSGFISMIGFHFCFGANRHGDNVRFLERFFCLFAVLSVWFAAFYIVFFVGGFYALQTWLRINVRAWMAKEIWLSPSISVTMIIVYFIILHHFIARTANSDAQELSTAPIAAP